MKITGFNPKIITRDPEPVVALFEELGFEKRHTKENIGKLNITDMRMKDANGFYLDVSRADVGQPQDMVTIRINVDDFDEACQALLSHGFQNAFGGRIAETGSSINAVLRAPSGFTITLVQHIRN